jgi:hypothetical protein
VRWSFFNTMSTSMPGLISCRFLPAIWYNPFCLWQPMLLEPISKMSFASRLWRDWCPALNPRHTIVCLRFTPTEILGSDGKSRFAGKLGPAARVPAKPLGEDGILNQNPIFEMGSKPAWSLIKAVNLTSQEYG